MNKLLYGHNPETGIVALQHVSDSQIRIYKRTEGKIQHNDVEFFPFFFLTDKMLLSTYNQHYWLKELQGTNPFRYIVAFQRWSDMWSAIHTVVKNYSDLINKHVSSYTEVPYLFLRNNPIRQFLLQTGITLFKGLSFNELKVLYIDLLKIETSGTSQSSRSHSEHFYFLASTNDGKVFQPKPTPYSPKRMLKGLLRFIQKTDPDIIIGEHLTTKILPFIIERCNSFDIPLTLGRDNSQVSFTSHRLPFYTPDTVTPPIEIAGRHTLDIHSLVEAFESHISNSMAQSLDSLASSIGIETELQHVNERTLQHCWKNDSESFFKYSQQRLNLLRTLADRYLPRAIHLAQLCPLPLPLLLQLNSSFYIESIMLRYYINQRYSLPQPQKIPKHYFAFSEAFCTGVFQNVIQLKVESLYYSATKDILLEPSSDQFHVFSELRKSIEHELEHSEKNSLQYNVFQMLLNAQLLMLGNPRALFNDSQQAEIVAEHTLQLLKNLKETLERFNVLPLHLERDILYAMLPDNVQGKESEESLLSRINRELSYPLSLHRIRAFKSMLLYRTRSYALLGHNDTLKIVGSSLYNKNAEPFIRSFTIECIRCILERKYEELHELYLHYYTMITNHKWKPTDFCKIEVAKMNVHDYSASLSNSTITPTPGMEAARRALKNVKQGEAIAYFVSGNHADVAVTDASMLLEEWNPITPNENTAYYLARLHDVVDRFKEFFDYSTFRSIFSPDSLFVVPNDRDGKRTQPKILSKVQSEQSSYDIDSKKIELDLSDSSN